MKINRRHVMALASASPLVAMPFVKRAVADDKVLNVYNWADYIGETTVEDFQKATGISVTYDIYNSTDEMQAKMLAGHSGYDIATTAGLNLQRFIQANLYAKLDKSKLPNWKNLDPDVMKIGEGFDPGEQYGMPYMWGSVGFTYNLDMVKERLPNADLESMDTIMKPENAEKLADCGISLLDEPTDLLQMTLMYLGKPKDVYKKEDMTDVIETFNKVRKYIRTFDSANYLNAIPNKELCVINNWSGDYSTAKNRAKDAGVDINLAYFVPKTGAPAWIDYMCIPADSQHIENAHAFLNYLMEPEVIAKCTDFTNYANANLASKAFINPDVLKNPAVYPDATIMQRLYSPKSLSNDDDRLLIDTLSAIKSAS